MKLFTKLIAGAAGATALAAAGQAAAVTVDWVNWTVVLPSQEVDGTITTPGGPIGVAFNGHQLSEQVAGGGPDNWVDLGYTQGVVNRPPGTDIITLGGAGLTETITFSTAVINPFIAFADWRDVTALFSAPFNVISQGCGVNGCGTFVTNPANTAFLGSGDVYGVLQFQGTFTQLSFVDRGETPHGFTVGVTDASVPEPSAWALMIVGFGAAGALLRRRIALA